jgi:hypothetical protein
MKGLIFNFSISGVQNVFSTVSESTDKIMGVKARCFIILSLSCMDALRCGI